MEAGKQVALQTKKARRQQGKPKYGEREEGKRKRKRRTGARWEERELKEELC